VLCRKEINYIKMSQKEREQLTAEFNILSSLRHPNIVAYYHREHLKASQDLYLYMEYCGGGDLGMVIKNLKNSNKYAEEEFVWRVLSQLATALYRCHYGADAPAVGANVLNQSPPKQGLKGKQAQVMILHRDLKPENSEYSSAGFVCPIANALPKSSLVATIA
jgi:NIMA (never in mitosis gene a)-related kinase